MNQIGENMKYPMKEQMMADIEAEIAMLLNGITCAPRFVRVMCMNKIQELRWKQSRIKNNKDCDVRFMPKSVGHPKWKEWTIEKDFR